MNKYYILWWHNSLYNGEKLEWIVLYLYQIYFTFYSISEGIKINDNTTAFIYIRKIFDKQQE